MEINIYNMYIASFLGFKYSPEDVQQMGLDPLKYIEVQKEFTQLCDTLGNRLLAYLNRNNSSSDFFITPQPIDQGLLQLNLKCLGLTNGQQLISTGGLQNIDEDIAATILDNGEIVDQLRSKISDPAATYIYPRTVTQGSVLLARALGVNHSHRHPNIPVNLQGIFPSLEYLESHEPDVNNSKVRNYVKLQELDQEFETDFAPEGGVAFDYKQVLQLIASLNKRGKSSMIKADLSVDGMGNVVIDPDRTKIEGVPLLECEQDVQINYLKRILGERSVPLGDKAGVVVQEFLREKIADPSLEFFSLPLSFNIAPIVTYSCSMLIKNGGFAGSLMTNKLFGEVEGIDGVEEEEYLEVMQQSKRLAREFVRRLQLEGYVGISDCDIALCRDQRTGKLFAKILEFNCNRETGGTATEALLKSTRSPFVLARDSLSGPGFAMPITNLAANLDKRGVLFSSQKRNGVVVLNAAVNQGNGTIMPVILGENLAQVLELDQALNEIAQS